MNRLMKTDTVMTTKLYYLKDGNEVRDTIFPDLSYLATRLRTDDLEEMWASHHIQPYSALCQSYASSSLCMTLMLDKEPSAIFGCNPEGIAGAKAVIWFLATERILEVKLEFLRYSRNFVEVMLAQHPILYNYVDARNKKSLHWLKAIGADIHPAKSYGMELLPFHYFEFRRKP